MNVADGKTYCIEQEVTVSDANGDLESVTLNGEAVTLVDGNFTVTGKEGQQTIVATDKAGNVTTVKITVNAAHIGGAATCEDKAVCSVCNVEYGKLADHKGGTATCTDKAKCEVCGEAYGEKNADKHTKEAKWTITADKHSKAYECCGTFVEIAGDPGVDLPHLPVDSDQPLLENSVKHCQQWQNGQHHSRQLRVQSDHHHDRADQIAHQPDTVYQRPGHQTSDAGGVAHKAGMNVIYGSEYWPNLDAFHDR